MLRHGLIFLSDSRVAKKLVTGTPLRAMSRRFVPGETVEELAGAMVEANGKGLEVTANYLGESEQSERSARAAANTYLEVLDRVATDGIRGNVSLKFTQLGQAIGARFLADNLNRLLERARAHELFIRFDMESSEYTQRTLDAFEQLWGEGWRDIGVVLQSYLMRSEGDVARMNALGARVRLCKGAYAEPASVAFQGREEVDAAYVRLMQTLLANGNYPAIATHDERMIDATVRFAERKSISRNRFEFQMLYGVRRDLQAQLVDQGFRVRVYIPFGESWYPYLMRRLAERPANMLFMTGSVIKESPLGRLWPGNGHARKDP
ncbi:MAG: proline dehydrogenase [Gemmatimonadota bacterium]|nr:MAG: proline dehydrogenase [Gemmatimonadota bacterium]